MSKPEQLIGVPKIYGEIGATPDPSRIGGTDAATVCLGLRPFGKTQEKIRQRILTGEGWRGMSERMEAGLRLEPVVAEWAADKMGFSQSALTRARPIRPEEASWFRASPDYDLGESLMLEIKTTAAQYKGEWAEQIPAHYQAQVQWVMHAFDKFAQHTYEGCVFGVLFGGQDLQCFRLDYDRDLAANMYDVAERWYEKHVVGDEPCEDAEPEPPPVSLHDKPGPIGVADEAGESLIRSIFARRDTIDELKKQAKRDEEQLLAIIGNRKGLRGDTGTARVVHEAGRSTTKWAAVAAQLRAELDDGIYQRVITRHRSPGAPRSYLRMQKPTSK